MATSNSVNFTLTRNDIVTEALELCQVLAGGETPDGEDLVTCSRSLNMLAKAWMADGLHLFQKLEVTLFHTVGATSYTLGTDRASADHLETTLSAAEAAAQTVLSITSTAGMTAGDAIGIELDDSTRQWTTIVTVDSATQVTVTAALTSAAASGNTVYTYTTLMDTPTRVISARRRSKDGNEVPVSVLSREDYMQLANKTNKGKIVQVFYDRSGSGKLSVWPTADVVSDMLNLTVERPIDDFDAATDNPDFPVEWFEALSYGLAARVATKYGVNIQERTFLKMEAERYKADILAWDNEDTSVFFQPEFR